MSRPIRCRRIRFAPEVRLFKPAGVPARHLEEVVLTMDELEALRLVDLEGRYQDGAAESMSISRPTLSRILSEGRRKIAEALVMGKVVRVEGGEVRLDSRQEGPAAEGDCVRRHLSRRRCRRSRRHAIERNPDPRQCKKQNGGAHGEQVVEES